MAWHPDEHLDEEGPASDEILGTLQWLVFADKRGTGQQVVARLRSKGASCIVVSRGREYRQNSEQAFQLDPTNLEHFRRLLQRIPNLQAVIHRLSLDAPDTLTTPDDLDRAIAIGCASVLHLVRSCVQAYPELPALWLG